MSALKTWTLLLVIFLGVMLFLLTLRTGGHPFAVLRVLIAQVFRRPMGRHRRKLTTRF